MVDEIIRISPAYMYTHNEGEREKAKQIRREEKKGVIAMERSAKQPKKDLILDSESEIIATFAPNAIADILQAGSTNDDHFHLFTPDEDCID